MYGQLAHPNASRVVNGRRQGGSDTGVANLANAACAKFVEYHIGVVEKGYIDLRSVGVRRNDVIRKVAVDRGSVARVVYRFFEKGHADAHHHGSLDLIAGGT